MYDGAYKENQILKSRENTCTLSTYLAGYWLLWGRCQAHGRRHVDQTQAWL